MSATLERDRPAAPARPKKTKQARQHSINIRAQERQVTVIDRAAAAVGQNRSEFMLERSVQAAEAVLLDKRLFVVDDETYAAFEAAMTAPARPNPKLAALMKKRAPWER